MKLKNHFLNYKEKFMLFYKKNKKIFFISISCIICVIFLFISSLGSLNKNKKTSSSVSNSGGSVTAYADSIENKIVSIISKIDEVKNVNVFVMVESTPIYNFLTEKKEHTITNSSGSTTEITTTVVFEKNGSSNSPVIVQTIMPKITGVLIITNKINIATKLSIIKSISIVLNIDESCISLLQES